MRKVFNLAKDEEIRFGDEVSPEHATAYAYCSENNRMSEFFTAAMAGGEKFAEFFKSLPVIRGTCSIAVGDWATVVTS